MSLKSSGGKGSSGGDKADKSRHIRNHGKHTNSSLVQVDDLVILKHGGGHGKHSGKHGENEHDSNTNDG